MVQLANFEKFRPQSEKAVVKLEIGDPLEEEHNPLNKKPKLEDGGLVPPHAAQCSLLDEPSPLGLRLRKSPSLLDLIQMRLSQGNSVTPNNGGFEAGKKELKPTAMLGATDKLKASNFPATLLRIGSWERVSRYEGDLVAKCYYAKHKLVWEVLDGGLKSKIEIQWSDISALHASCPENAPGTLDIVLARQPLFFRETNPQPRKHTLWQATSDFTNNQASIHRWHFLQCPPGLLIKHFEKLIQCDPRLNSLSRQPDIILECPYFEQRSSVFEDHDESKCHGFDNLKDGFTSTMSGFRDHVSACAAPSSNQNETGTPIGRSPGNVSQETLSPSSVIDTRAIEENPTTSGTKELLNDPKPWDQIMVPGLRSSMSMSDLVNHIGHCISGQTTPGNPLIPTDSSLNKSAFEELTQYLLGDSQVNSASDEQSLMSRVGSLCCLIQHKNPTADDDDNEDDDASDNDRQEVEMKLSMSRKESYGELLMHLPRIASMPFLFNITEDSENQAI